MSPSSSSPTSSFEAAELSKPTPFTITTFYQSPLPKTTSTKKDPAYSASERRAASNQTLVYVVRPNAIWASLTRFRRFELNGESYTFNDRIIYQPPGSFSLTQQTKSTSSPQIAHVLEIRGFNGQHVYIRAFLFRPASEVPRRLLPSSLTTESAPESDVSVSMECPGTNEPVDGHTNTATDNEDNNADEDEEDQDPIIPGRRRRHHLLPSSCPDEIEKERNYLNPSVSSSLAASDADGSERNRPAQDEGQHINGSNVADPTTATSRLQSHSHSQSQSQPPRPQSRQQQPVHLLATNEMVILDARWVLGKVDVVRRRRRPPQNSQVVEDDKVGDELKREDGKGEGVKYVYDGWCWHVYDDTVRNVDERN